MLCFFVIERCVLMVLFFYFKGMLEKVTTQSTQQFSAFSLLSKESIKCSTCVVSQNIAIECGIAFLEIRLFLENRLARKYLRK